MSNKDNSKKEVNSKGYNNSNDFIKNSELYSYILKNIKTKKNSNDDITYIKTNWLKDAENVWSKDTYKNEGENVINDTLKYHLWKSIQIAENTVQAYKLNFEKKEESRKKISWILIIIFFLQLAVVDTLIYILVFNESKIDYRIIVAFFSGTFVQIVSLLIIIIKFLFSEDTSLMKIVSDIIKNTNQNKLD